ncbi:MAG: HigA family addiction module antidote protein [Desulfobacterales bacterium]|nr:HigA family addiction module antidote protein [Desulfobacterales bacterium]
MVGSGMGNAIENQYRPDDVSLPGETLLDTLTALGMSQAELAEQTGRSRKRINEIIKGKAPITQDFALDLERVLGVPASFWINREDHYRRNVEILNDSGRQPESRPE